ncbi:MAG: hypothetical protein WC960_01910 [Bacteroidales bacterium]
MRKIYKKYLAQDEIPIYNYIKKRKLVKYFTRDVMAAMVCVGELSNHCPFTEETPFFFSRGESEYPLLFEQSSPFLESVEEGYTFKQFFNRATSLVSPLIHFKTMRNMGHCFISIEYGFKGDNASLTGSLSGLLTSALLSNCEPQTPILIVASKLNLDSSAEGGAAIVTKRELEGHPLLNSNSEAIQFFNQ